MNIMENLLLNAVLGSSGVRECGYIISVTRKRRYRQLAIILHLNMCSGSRQSQDHQGLVKNAKLRPPMRSNEPE